MHVLSSTQHPSEIQHKVAGALGVPYHAVRVEIRRMGGGFGGKESQGNALAVACALAARLTGRSCTMRYDRDDDMMITGKRHPFRIGYRAGFDAEGRILGVVFEHFVNCGWSQDLSLPVADRAMLHADNAYYLPAVRITSHRLRTNLCSFTAFRGFGGPQGMVGIERVIDHIAAELGRDPLAVRAVNFYDQSGPRTVTPYHMTVEDSVIRELVAELAERADYAGRRARIVEENAGKPLIRKGIALTPVKFGISFTLTHLNQAGALVHVYSDGSIALNHGGTEMGQGLHTKVAQVAAAVFGQPVAAVRISATDTGKVPNTSATAASSGSDLNGMAVKAACETIAGRLRDFAAERWQVKPDAVRFAEGAVRIGCGERRLRRSGRAGLCRPHPALGHRVLRHAKGRVGSPRRTGPAVLLFRLWRGRHRGRARHADRREPHPARRHSPRCRRQPQSGHRHRPDRGRLRAGRRLADHGGTGLGRAGPARDPRPRHLQDPLRLGPAGDLQRRSLGRPQPGGHHPPIEGGGRAAAHAGHFRADGALRRRRLLRRRSLSRPRRSGDARTAAAMPRCPERDRLVSGRVDLALCRPGSGSRPRPGPTVAGAASSGASYISGLLRRLRAAEEPEARRA